jgi:hypothetical protein
VIIRETNDGMERSKLSDMVFEFEYGSRRFWKEPIREVIPKGIEP